VGSAASFLTAFYMFRAIFMTFFGASRVAPDLVHHIHEPPRTMSVVLAILAGGSALVGFIGLPQFWRELLGVSAPFYDFLAPVLHHAEVRVDVGHSAEWMLMVVAVLVAFAGIGLAWMRYGSGATDDTGAAPGTLRRWVSRGYYFDHFYESVLVRALGWLSRDVLARRVEPALSAGSLDLPAQGARASAGWLARLQSGNLQAYVLYALIGLVLMLGWGAAHV
jgi:NADH-quinone oxidoreductase subunit L